MDKWLPFALGAAFSVVLLLRAAAADRASSLRIVLVGDSTTTDESGWGSGFAKCFKPSVEIVNFARSGRSSKSYRDEGHWQKALESKPDYVLLQFGHNDQPRKGPERETDPDTTFRANMAQYVDEVIALGAKPILITSICRRNFDAYSKIRSDELIPYVKAVRRLAADKNVPLIDLYARSIDICQSLGPEGCEIASPRNDDGTIDTTHLNAIGAEMIGPIVADDLRYLHRELYRYFQPLKVQPVKVGRMVPAGEGKTFIVASDGSADFRTLQEAIVAMPDKTEQQTIIRLKPGVYYGPVMVPYTKRFLAIIGEDAASTIVKCALNIFDPIHPDVPYEFRGSGTIVLADEFHVSNVTFENTSGNHGAGMALYVSGDRAVFESCRILGYQDSLRVNSGRQYYHNCYIAGRGDFIYGASVAVFDHCTIASRDGGYVTAASTPAHFPYGLVFLDCKLVSDDGTPAFLGRPWRPYAHVAFIRCDMGPHIRPEGWHNWHNPANEKTARFVEYRTTGTGAAPDNRVVWSRQLTADEAKSYDVSGILKGNDGWNPAKKLPQKAKQGR